MYLTIIVYYRPLTKLSFYMQHQHGSALFWADKVVSLSGGRNIIVSGIK
jgi:hypothetical protein